MHQSEVSRVKSKRALTLLGSEQVKEEPITNSSSLICPDCGGKDLRRKGKNGSGHQAYRCKGCGRYITDNPQRPPQPLRSPAPIAPDLRCRHCGAEQLVRTGTKPSSAGRLQYRCKECKRFTTLGGRGREVIIGIPCPRCESENIRRHNKGQGVYQHYLCRDCRKSFTPDSPVGKTPPGLICPRCAGTEFHNLGFRRTGKPSYKCKGCNRVYTPNAKNPRREYVPNSDIEAEYAKDIWDLRNLGLDLNKAKSLFKVDFEGISQPRLRKATKQYIRYSLATASVSGSLTKLGAMRHFSVFLAEHHPAILPSEINRLVVTNYFSYLVSKKQAAGTRVTNISTVKVFFELCARNNWVDLSAKPVIYDDDFPKVPKRIPRYIPQEVLDHLNQHLDHLPEPVMHMTLVLQECGMRLSELLLLPFDCLIQDGQGDWFLRYYQSKMKKEIVIPVSREVVGVIQKQQQYIREHLGLEYEYLFCANRANFKDGFFPKNKPMSVSSFPGYLNRVAEQEKICDASGNLWRFEAHQFRHTVATRMINGGVPHHIVQRYLGHESPAMTSRYAHIHDQTLKKEIANFQGKVINVAGQIIEPEDSQYDTTDLQWFRRNILAQALPNGSCALPTITQGCPHANACLTCVHFRTTKEFLNQHKVQLEQTEQIVEKAKANNWVRQVEMNEKVVVNLQNIINSLEASNGG